MRVAWSFLASLGDALTQERSQLLQLSMWVLIAAACLGTSAEKSWLKRVVLVHERVWVKSWLCGRGRYPGHHTWLGRSHLRLSSMTS